MAGRRWLSRAFGLALALALPGCSANPYAQWKDLGAVYCNQVPLPGDARFEDAMGGDYYGESLDDHASESMAYWFTTKESPQKLVAFYEKTFPGATKEVSEDGETTFKVRPEGAQEGEEIYVTVRTDGKIQIGEETKVGKHKDSGLL